MQKILSLLLALLLCCPALAEADSPSERALNHCAALVAGDFAAVTADFDAAMAAQIDAATLAQLWNAYAVPMGAARDCTLLSAGEQGAYFAAIVQQSFENGALVLQFAFDGEDRIAGLFMQPMTAEVPAAEGPWTEVECTVEADPAYPLGAVLCLPQGVEKPPVVVLVHGSGASDRNETILQNAPFRDLAHGLAGLGIASLRYDKRPYSYPEMAGASGTDTDLRAEVLDDVNAAIELLRKDGRVNPQRIFVLGHSLGGMLLPAIAVENPDLAGGISMAGSLRNLWEISYDQNMAAAQAASAAGLDEATQALLEAQLAQIEADMKLLRGDFSSLPDGQTLLGVSARYWKSLKEYGGMNFIHEVDIPLLILQGEADFQVYAAVDYPLWQETLQGRENVECRLYPGLNHLMMPTQGHRDVSDYAQPGKVDSQVIADIAGFVNKY